MSKVKRTTDRIRVMARNRFREFLVLARRFRYQSPRSFIFIGSIVVGVIGGLSAVLIKTLVHLTGILIYSGKITSINYITILLPGIGILLTYLFIRYAIKDSIGHGVAKVLASISKESSRIRRHNTYSSIVGSSLTVGFGGSVGLEAPIVYTGAAIGANIAERFSLNYKLRTLFIACGSAATIAGIFKAPIAATIFALEVLMIDLNLWSIVPLLLASVSGATVSHIFMGEQVSFSFAIFEKFDMTRIPFYMLLGFLCGLFSLFFTLQAKKVENRFLRINKDSTKILFGGLVLGLLIFFFPPLFGEGYATLRELLGGTPENTLHNSFFYAFGTKSWYFVLFLGLVLLLKVFATSFTTASGGIGGVFAPALFMGGITGFLFSRIINNLNWIQLSEHNFSLVGMAGVMSGVMHAPLTSIFLIAEITGGYTLFVPLIITASISYLVKSYFDRHSIYTRDLALENALMTHNKDKTAMRMIDVESLVETDFRMVQPEMNLGDFVCEIAQSKRNTFPVVDKDLHFLGVVMLDDVRDVMFDHTKYTELRVSDYLSWPPAIITTTETASEILAKFDATDAWNLPVLDNGKYIGMLSKSRILQSYRHLLVTISED